MSKKGKKRRKSQTVRMYQSDSNIAQIDKNKRQFDFYEISKSRNVLFGLAALWICAFHSALFFPQPTSENPVLNSFFATVVFIRLYGQIGVDIFLLLSGVGLYFAYSKMTSLITFYKRRFARIIIPYVLTQIVYFPIAIFIWEISFKEQIERATLVSFWDRQELSSWYIAVILAYYLIYPLIHKAIVFFKTQKISLLIVKTVVFTFLSICLGVFIEYLAPSIYTLHLSMFLWRLPVFVFGCCIGEIVFLKRKVSRTKILLLSFLGFSIGIIFWYLFNAQKIPDPHILSCAHLLQIPFVFAVCIFVADFCAYHPRISRMRKFLIACGGLSLEFYLLFEKIVQLIYKYWIYVEEVVRKYYPLWVDNFGLIRNILAFIIMFQLAKLVSTMTKKVRNGIHL